MAVVLKLPRRLFRASEFLRFTLPPRALDPLPPARSNEELVRGKRDKAMSKVKKTPLGSNCPVCDSKLTKQARDHISW